MPDTLETTEEAPPAPAPGRDQAKSKMLKSFEDLMSPFVQDENGTPKPPDSASEKQTSTIVDKKSPIESGASSENSTNGGKSSNVESPKPSIEEELPEAIARGSSKAADEWKKIKIARDQFRAESEKNAAEAKTLRDELGRFKASPPKIEAPPEFESLKKDHETLKAERDKLSDELKVVAVERHPNFRSYYESKTTSAIEKAKSNLGAEIVEKAIKVAQLPPSEYRTEQLDKMIVEIAETSPSKGMFLQDLVRDIGTINFERESALRKARDDYDAVMRRNREEFTRLEEDQRKRQAEVISVALEAAKGMESFKPKEPGKPDESVAAREQFVRDFLVGKIDPKILPFVPVLYQEAEYLRNTELPRLRDENSKLLKQITEMTGSGPRAADGGGAKQASAKSGDPKADAVRKFNENMSEFWRA